MARAKLTDESTTPDELSGADRGDVSPPLWPGMWKRGRGGVAGGGPWWREALDDDREVSVFHSDRRKSNFGWSGNGATAAAGGIGVVAPNNLAISQFN